MPHLALTRKGVAEYLDRARSAGALWIGSDVLSGAEVSLLRMRGFDVTVFVHPVHTSAEIEGAKPVLREHHPGEHISVESIPASFNPKSNDVGQAFLWREPIVGVNYWHNDPVRVQSGPYIGYAGVLVALVDLQPEVTFILETDDGKDIEVAQSVLASRVDA